MDKCQRCKKEFESNELWVSREGNVCCGLCLRELEENLRREVEANER